MAHARRIAIAQTNPTIGDFEHNVEQITALLDEAQAQGAHLVVFGELAIPGYSPLDLLLRPEFVDANQAALGKVVAACRHTAAVVGFVDRGPYNAAAVIERGKILGVHHKRFLPNYSIFDEKRYFRQGEDDGLFDTRLGRLGVTVCEDAWHPGLPESQASNGAHIAVNISASPYVRGKIAHMERMFRTRSGDNQIFSVFCNQFAGQDGIIYYGHGMLVNPFEEILLRTFSLHASPKDFAGELHRSEGAGLFTCDVDLDDVERARMRDLRTRERSVAVLGEPPSDGFERELAPLARRLGVAAPPEATAELCEMYNALVLGVRDYVRKCGVKKVVLGLSGGIDSTLVTYVAVDALGPDAVEVIMMPRTGLTSERTMRDSDLVVKDLGIKHHVVSIDAPVEAARYPWAQAPLQKANDQARERMKILYNHAGAHGALVLGTSNKSEVALGYGTKHADMASDFAVIGSVWKTDVFRLARLRALPESIVTRKPTAELIEGQTDEGEMGFTYESADHILQMYVDQNMSEQAIIAAGADAALVAKIIRRFHLHEHKRTVLARSIKVSEQSFHPIEWRQVVSKRLALAPRPEAKRKPAEPKQTRVGG
ncbi:MAG: NAD(+) synthase [Planctomycetota bacterium]